MAVATAVWLVPLGGLVLVSAAGGWVAVFGGWSGPCCGCCSVALGVGVMEAAMIFASSSHWRRGVAWLLRSSSRSLRIVSDVF